MSQPVDGPPGEPIPPATSEVADDFADAEQAALFGADPADSLASIGPRVPPIPPSEQAAAATPGDLALAEEKSLSQNATPEDLAANAAMSEHHRDQRFRDAFEYVAIASLYLAYFAIGTMALVWVLNLILPDYYRWLTPEQLNHLQTFLTAGVLVGVVSNHFKKRLGVVLDKPKP